MSVLLKDKRYFIMIQHYSEHNEVHANHIIESELHFKNEVFDFYNFYYENEVFICNKSDKNYIKFRNQQINLKHLVHNKNVFINKNYFYIIYKNFESIKLLYKKYTYHLKDKNYSSQEQIKTQLIENINCVLNKLNDELLDLKFQKYEIEEKLKEGGLNSKEIHNIFNKYKETKDKISLYEKLYLEYKKISRYRFILIKEKCDQNTEKLFFEYINCIVEKHKDAMLQLDIKFREDYSNACCKTFSYAELKVKKTIFTSKYYSLSGKNYEFNTEFLKSNYPDITFINDIDIDFVAFDVPTAIPQSDYNDFYHKMKSSSEIKKIFSNFKASQYHLNKSEDKILREFYQVWTRGCREIDSFIKNPDNYKNKKDSKRVDAEHKILKSIYLSTSAKTVGELNIYTTSPACISCVSSYFAFNKVRKNIRIKVHTISSELLHDFSKIV